MIRRLRPQCKSHNHLRRVRVHPHYCRPRGRRAVRTRGHHAPRMGGYYLRMRQDVNALAIDMRPSMASGYVFIAGPCLITLSITSVARSVVIVIGPLARAAILTSDRPRGRRRAIQWPKVTQDGMLAACTFTLIPGGMSCAPCPQSFLQFQALPSQRIQMALLAIGSSFRGR